MRVLREVGRRLGRRRGGDGAGDPIACVPTQTLVFLHVPKCGGTSIHRWLEDVVPPKVLSEERHLLPEVLDPSRAARLRDRRVFSGHFDLLDLARFPSPSTVFTVLRDPVDRLVSLYDYWRAFDPTFVEANDLDGPRGAIGRTFEEFVGEPHPAIVHQVDNAMTRIFGGRARPGQTIDDPEVTLAIAIRVLGGLDHVGRLDRLDETFAWLAGVCGLPQDLAAGGRRENVRGRWTEPHMRTIEPTEVTEARRRAAEPAVALDQRLFAEVFGQVTGRWDSARSQVPST